MALLSPPLRLEADAEIRVSIAASGTSPFFVEAFWANTLNGPPRLQTVGRVNHMAGDRGRENTDFGFGGGFLYGLGASTATARRGSLWVELRIGRDNRFITLSAGYISSTKGLFPGELNDPLDGRGVLIKNEAPSTLVNNVALTRTIMCPTNALWKVHSGHVFNADNVARGVIAVADQGVSNENFFMSGDSTEADLGASERLALGSSGMESVAAHRTAGLFPLFMDEVDRFRITFEAGGASAGGTARSALSVEEWINI